MLVNIAWTERFPKLIKKSLPRLGSDDVPIQLEVGHISNLRLFRYQLVWNTAEGLHELVQ